MLTRRTFLERSFIVSAGVAVAPAARGWAATESTADSAMALSFRKDAPFRLPANFIGLGYEMSSVAPLGLLSASNERYVQMVKQLGGSGVLRVGGIVADYTRYEPNGTISTDPHHTVITQASLEQLNGFLKKIGWTVIWNLNFAQGSLDQAVTEATAVASILGKQLQAFEIGNEVENYGRGAKTFRPAPYTYETYRTEYAAWHDAIHKAVPSARFAAPDTADNVQWVENMASDAHGEVGLLTTHYYRGNQKQGSAEQLLTPDPRLLDKLLRLRTASTQSNIPWRMCETNSFFGGGRPGVSDTFVGALWTLDFMLLLGSYGCSGVNLETGVNQLGFVSPYSPIQDDGKGVNSAGAPYYGMLAFAEARKGNTDLRALDLPEGMEELTAYAFGNNGAVRSVVIINRGSLEETISLSGLGLHSSSAMRLSAPAADSKSGITFAGSAVEATGHWAATQIERVAESQVSVPAMSAIVVRG